MRELKTLQLERKIEGGRDRQSGRQTDRQTERQKDRESGGSKIEIWTKL